MSFKNVYEVNEFRKAAMNERMWILRQYHPLQRNSISI